MCAIVIHEITIVHSLIVAAEAGALRSGLALGLFLRGRLGSQRAPDPFRGRPERSTMVSRQLELGFGNPLCCPPAGRRRGRGSRAHWWFDRMRVVVSGTPDREPDSVPEAAPRPAGVPAQPDPLKSGAAPRTLNPEPPVSTPNSPRVLEAPRWKFARTKRQLWE
jgi:hypothetical protein